jgi:hypothetical protein
LDPRLQPVGAQDEAGVEAELGGEAAEHALRAQLGRFSRSGPQLLAQVFDGIVQMTGRGSRRREKRSRHMARSLQRNDASGEGQCRGITS